MRQSGQLSQSSSLLGALRGACNHPRTLFTEGPVASETLPTGRMGGIPSEPLLTGMTGRGNYLRAPHYWQDWRVKGGHSYLRGPCSREDGGQFPQRSMFLGEMGTHLLRGPRYWEQQGASIPRGLCDWKDLGEHLPQGPSVLGGALSRPPSPLLGGLGEGNPLRGPRYWGSSQGPSLLEALGSQYP